MADGFTVSAGYELIKIAKREGWFQWARDSIRKKHRVILMGSTGVGKSQFIRSLQDPISKPLNHLERTEFAHSTRIDLDGLLFQLIDVPGPRESSVRRMQAFRDAMSLGLCGIINVVCYGYHEYGADRANVISGAKVRQDYLKEHRERELKLIAEWAPLAPRWVLTLANKADIWWDQKDAVSSYYTSGIYAERVRTLAPGAHHLICPYSAVNTLFYGEISNSGKFDDNKRSSLRNNALRLMRESTAQVS